MKLLSLMALAIGILALAPSAAPNSTTITFGDVSRDIGDMGPIVESDSMAER